MECEMSSSETGAITSAASVCGCLEGCMVRTRRRCRDGRVVKAMDLKSIGDSPRRFESCSRRPAAVLPSTPIASPLWFSRTPVGREKSARCNRLRTALSACALAAKVGVGQSNIFTVVKEGGEAGDTNAGGRLATTHRRREQDSNLRGKFPMDF
ncbi:charged multivesicular body protein 3 [Echinococcus multilocularis]|uniref:Charged multivesicular body protein 3 n=1 Tax=Echinococcus multilocularis TaxID=6211 RepID=A0A0S4MJL5_ECHMU|nr:charged multivesicular body protein 3 [Echinococcus multilocularis]